VCLERQPRHAVVVPKPVRYDIQKTTAPASERNRPGVIERPKVPFRNRRASAIVGEAGFTQIRLIWLLSQRQSIGRQ
jgi:hypothetical protein